MNADAIVTQVRSMIAENPVTVTNEKTDGDTQTLTAGVANVDASTEQLKVGSQQTYRRSIWTISADWEELPGKGDVLVVDGTRFRVQDYKAYYMAVRRYDLSDEFEARR